MTAGAARACPTRGMPFSRASGPEYSTEIYILTVALRVAIFESSPLIEGRLRRRAEGGAGSGVLRLPVRTRRTREARDPARQALSTWLRGARWTDSGGNAGNGSADPGQKSPRWSAERRARRSQDARRA